MGQELVARSGDEPTSLWATRVMIDHPGMVRAIHEDYFAAGATVATTNTYATHHDRLERFDLDHMFRGRHGTRDCLMSTHGRRRRPDQVMVLTPLPRDRHWVTLRRRRLTRRRRPLRRCSTPTP